MTARGRGRIAARVAAADSAAAQTAAPVRTPGPARRYAAVADVTICIDGASRGNPGRAAIGIVVLAGGETVKTVAERIGVTTNNVAEYRALLRGLDEAASLGASTVHVQSDSELLVRQILGEYKVRHDTLIPLHREATARLRGFDHVHVFHVPRARNAAADALANRALDKRE